MSPFRVAAVVVTYYPSTEALERLLQATRPQVEAVIIVDNTPPQAGSTVDARQFDGSVVVIRNGRNAGLACAQNQGIRWAAAGGFTHVFTLDQDSVPDTACVQRLHEALLGLTRRGLNVGAVGPRVQDRRTGRAYSFKRFSFAGTRHGRCALEEDVIPADFVIASGSLTPMVSIEAVGPMDEGLFIDRIDIDWCLRAIAMGRPVFGVCAARMQHEPGAHARRLWIGRWVEAAVHAPERNYYMVRNSVVLYRKPYAPLRWILNDAIWLVGVVVFSCIVAPDRLRRVGLAFRGLWDGLRRVQGPLASKKNAQI
ncbi:MAG TPA: glycosyltransferase family 2 protein [Burkholderiales bacterium]|nr:glycosyltransferase family 2 protein [Burkholderiales bacterium]